MESTIQKASTNRCVYDKSLFNTTNTKEWERAYRKTVNEKYRKNTKNYSTKIVGSYLCDDPPIFLIPRERGGPSYYSVNVDYENYPSEEIKSKMQYCAISKGFGMQDLSSFVMGPFPGDGLCLVNAAFSKSIFPFHIEGGAVDLNRKNFWRPFSKSKLLHTIKLKNNNVIIDNENVDIMDWLKNNEKEWKEEWNKWRMAVALCSMGNFHRGKCGNQYDDALCYYDNKIEKYMTFLEWKKECYIKPAYEMLPSIKAYKFLSELRSKGIPLGLVHPMAKSDEPEIAITKEYIRELYDSPHVMSCMPFVVAGKLLDVFI